MATPRVRFVLVVAVLGCGFVRGAALVHDRVPSGSCTQWEQTRQGWPLLSLPGDGGLTQVEIEHRARVKKVEGVLASLDGQLCVLDKGPESNQVHDTSYKSRRTCPAIDLKNWKDVLRVDKDDMIVCAEPMVQIKALVDATLKHGMLPRVLPEFKHITVGGAIMGAALESSSHMHGDFLDGCRAVELLLGNGSVIWCSRTEHADLFAALSGSYGTLALLLSARIECQPAFPFVEIKYRLYPSVPQGIAALSALCGSVGRGTGSTRAPFVDALALQLRANSTTGNYSHVLVMTAAYTHPTPTHPPPPPQDLCAPEEKEVKKTVTLDKSWALWFFEHASRVAARLLSRAQLSQQQPSPPAGDTLGVPLPISARTRFLLNNKSAGNADKSAGNAREGSTPADADADAAEITYSEIADTCSYLFRYDFGAFWMARPMAWQSPLTQVSAPTLALFLASSPPLRWLTGWMFSTARLFRLLRLAPRDIVADKMIILDAYMPAHTAAEFIQRVDKNVPVSTPLWLCPVAPPERPQLLAPHGKAKTLLINVGVYGRVCDNQGRAYSKSIEAEVAALGGRKMLYSHNFYSRAQFWGCEAPFDNTMPSEDEYLALRKKYGAEGVYVSLFDKVCEESRGEADTKAPLSLASRIFRRLASCIL